MIYSVQKTGLSHVINPAMRIVGTRPCAWASTDSYATLTVATSRTRHKVLTRTRSLSLVFSGFKSMSVFAVPTELGMGSNYELKVAIAPISSGTTEEARIPLWFNNGAHRRVVVRSGSWVVTDPIEYDFEPGKEFYVYTWTNRLASSGYSDSFGVGLLASNEAYFPRAVGSRVFGSGWGTDEGCQFSNSTGIDPFTFDKVDSGTLSLNHYNIVSGPCAILGIPNVGADYRSIALIGDSILAGAGDLSSSRFPWSGSGYGATALAGVPTWQQSIGGNGVQYLVDGYAYNWVNRRRWANHCNTAFVALGTNDLASGRSVAEVKADLLKLYRVLRDGGMSRIYVGTLLPRAASTDAWITTANQSEIVAGFGAKAAELNRWLRNRADGVVDGIVELADAVESGRDSGLWKPSVVDVDTTSTAGSTTTTINVGTTLVSSAHIGKLLLIGTAARQINANTTTSVTVSTAFSGAPTDGTQVRIVDAYTLDGVHPAGLGHAALAEVVTLSPMVYGV